jgi:FixJ family two-component response regulator
MDSKYIVIMFCDPLESMDYFKGDVYRPIILDVKMRQINGFEFDNEMQKKISIQIFVFLQIV